MELAEARKIAQYVVPRLLFDLPHDIKIRLVRPQENEDGMLFRLVEKAASDIQWKAMALDEDRKREQYL